MTRDAASATQRGRPRRPVFGPFVAALVVAGLLAVATPASAQSTGVCAVLDGIDQLNDGFFGAGSGLGADGALGELHRTIAGIPIAGAVLRAVVAAIDGCDV